MGDYSFDRLNARDFEHMIQSLSKSVLGKGTITFGDGPDGGREATFEGNCPFPSELERWSGRWIVQAKFKQNVEENENDFSWIRKQFSDEMKKIIANTNKGTGYLIPDNYILFTNIKLTGVLERGGRDKIEALKNNYKAYIPNIAILGYDDLCRFLDCDRDVATSYASFILPGDILHRLFSILNQDDQSNTKNYSDLIGRFLENEFIEDMYSRLEQGGKLTDENVNLEKVFIDLYATKDGLLPNDTNRSKRFVSSCMSIGDNSHKIDGDTCENRFVLIGGPGQGKSTLTQFICQVYRAYFLNRNDGCKLMQEVQKFIEEYCQLEIDMLKCIRFPFRIILKDYAGWLSNRKKEDKSASVLSYFHYKLESKGEGQIELEDVRQLLRSLSFMFVFDGLDEVPITSNRFEVIEEINRFIDIELRRASCDALIIATTRAQGYLGEFDSSKYIHLKLTDLSKNDCDNYLSKLLGNMDLSVEQRRNHIEMLRKALEDDVTARLMKSPLQATIMAILVRSGGEPPRNRYNLFSKYYKTIFDREKQKGVVAILQENDEYIERIHHKLGFTLQVSSEGEENPSSSISIQDFKVFVETYLHEIELPQKKINTYTSEIMQAITDRLVFITEVEDGRVGFSIRSIQEYFAAYFYLHDQQDAILPERLKRIAGSAYWRNTFLFAMGYIRQNKSYLVDIIDAHCAELNGSGEGYGVKSGKSVSKLGSWLALDILNEGVFRGIPKYENKFARHLKDLFQIPPIDDHAYFGKLPSEVVEGFIMKYITEFTNSNLWIERHTSWTIASYLVKHGYAKVAELLDVNWPIDQEEVRLIQHIDRIVGSTNWFLKKLALAIAKHGVFDFRGEISDWRTIERLVKYRLLSDEAKRKIVQNLFVISLGNYYDRESNWGRLINKIIGKQLISKDITLAAIVTTEIEVIDGVNARLHSINIKNKELLGEYKVLFEELEVNYLAALCESMIEPSKYSIAKFIQYLISETDDVFNEIRVQAGTINWVMQRVFREFPTRDKLRDGIEQMRAGVFGDVDDWTDIENRLINKDLHAFRELSPYLSYGSYNKKPDQRTLLAILHAYDNLSQEYFETELLRTIFVSRENQSFIESIVSNENLLERVCNVLQRYNQDNYLLAECWLGLIGKMTLQQLVSLSLFNPTVFQNISFPNVFLHLGDSQSTYDAVEKIIVVISLAEVENSIIRFAPFILQKSLEFEKVKMSSLDFERLHQLRFETPENEISRVILCLIDSKMDRAKMEANIEVIRELSITNRGLFDHLITIIGLAKLKGEWMELLISDVLDLIDHQWDNSSTLSRYTRLLKHISEGHLTGLSSDPLVVDFLL